MTPCSPIPRCRRLLALAGLLLAVPLAARAADEPQVDRLLAALKEGKLSVSLRYRYEHVTDEAPAWTADADASTLRTTVSYRTAHFRGFGAVVEFEDVTDAGLAAEHANAGAGSLANGVSGRPVIADPEVTEVNQAYLSIRRLPETTVRLGRQEITLGDQRFIGAVGWRQNQQSFDAVTLVQESIARTRLTYAYLDRVHRVFGDSQGLSGHLLDAEVAVGATVHLTSYVYHLDYDEPSAAALSTTTWGLRWRDQPALGDGWSIPYHVEAARQRDAGDNPLPIDAGYLRLQTGLARAGWWVRAEYESLEGGPGGGAFSTPLATLHAFNGWADKFLRTPPDGLADLSLAAGWGRKGAAATLAYHEFTAETGDGDYGREIDAQWTYKAPWQQLFGVKAALYDARSFAADTEKLWLWTTYTF